MWYPYGKWTEGKKTCFLRHFILKMITLPRQARDKHRESTQKETRFHIVDADERLRFRVWWD
jgi:hypothetical protein